MKIMAVLFTLLGAVSSFGDAAFIDFDLKLVFPQELGGLAFEHVEKYNNEAFGYTVFYESDDGLKAEATVYDLGQGTIPDGHEGKAVNLVFESVESLLEKRIEGEAIANVRKRGSTVVPKKGDIRFANTVFQYSEPPDDPTKRIQSVYVTGTHGNLLKLDFRFDMVEGKRATAVSQKMLLQLINMVQAEPAEQELLMAACDALIHDPAGYGGRTAAQRVLAKTQTLGGLNVHTRFFSWPDGYRKPKTADLLVAAYFAGMLKVVVPQQLEEGGEYEAFVALLQAYEAMRAKDQIEALPELDEWAKNPDKKALFEKFLEEGPYK